MNFLIIFSPIILFFNFILVYLILQKINYINYLKNLFYTFFFVLISISLIILKFFNHINFQEIVYLYFSFFCISFISFNLIQLPISSLHVSLIRMIKKYPNINKNQIQIKFNLKNIFDQRIKRLIKTNIITKKKSTLKLKNDKFLIALNLINLIRRLYGFRM